MEHFPAPIVRAGDNARYRFLGFFTAQIRNRNTRRAYVEATLQFFAWTEQHGLELTQLNSVVIATYIEQHPAVVVIMLPNQRLN